MEKQENQAQFIYPIPFQDFLHSRKKQKEAALSNFNAKQMSKLRKLKKLLEMTEEKICNRIKLFKKVSVEIRKRKQKQYNYQERIQNIKRKALPGDQVKNNWGHSYMRPTKSSAGLKRVRQISEAEKAEHSEKKTDVFLEEKLQQAQEIKMWKQKNKSIKILILVIVEQRKLREMREKIQSANIIRSNRHKVKVRV